MYQNVTPHLVIDNDGGIYGQGFLIQCVEKRSGLIVAGAKAGDGEIFDPGRCISCGICVGIDEDPALGVNDADRGIQVSVQGGQVLLKVSQSQ